MNAAFADDPVMVQLGRPGAINPASLDALRTAMFARGPTVLTEPRESGDEEQDWADPEALAEEPVLEPAAPWQWHGPADVVEGPSWGGSLEIADFQLRTGRACSPTPRTTGVC